MSIRKQIEALQKKRNAHLDAMQALSETAATETRLFTEDEQKAFDKDQAEVRDIDAQLDRLEEAERQLAGRAQPVPSPTRPRRPSVEVQALQAVQGAGFVRLALRGRSHQGQPPDGRRVRRALEGPDARSA